MDPFVAEIRILPFQFAPTGWALCDGQLMPISQNTALFSLLGTQYGGDGKSTFGLPNLQGSVPMHTDRYSGGGQYPIGISDGEQSVTLLQSEIPLHGHSLQVSEGTATDRIPTAKLPAKASGIGLYNSPATTPVLLAPSALAIAGSSFPHNNMQPYLCVSFCIALQGVFPQRP